MNSLDLLRADVQRLEVEVRKARDAARIMRLERERMRVLAIDATEAVAVLLARAGNEPVEITDPEKRAVFYDTWLRVDYTSDTDADGKRVLRLRPVLVTPEEREENARRLAEQGGDGEPPEKSDAGSGLILPT